jgi:general secretion pathway protein L
MKPFETISVISSALTGSVAGAVIAALDRLVSPRVVRLIEDESGGFAVESQGKHAKTDHVPQRLGFSAGAFSGANLGNLVRGSRVEIVLRPSRFLFRPLQLPARAADFIEGIVRAQIDRLTPWSTAEAVFGCSAPVESGGDSIATTVAATTRKAVTGYVEAVSGFHPATVAIFAGAAEEGAARIKVFEQKARGQLDAARLSRGLQVALGAAAAAALIALAVDVYVANDLGARGDELARQISARRAAIRAGSAGDRSPVAVLERRKYETAASAIVLDALSQILPDHTYVTELHLSGDKLQIAGITRDAPSLIPLIEQSQHFARATFYAPTTRAPTDPGERFHIEVRVEPKNTASP